MNPILNMLLSGDDLRAYDEAHQVVLSFPDDRTGGTDVLTSELARLLNIIDRFADAIAPLKDLVEDHRLGTSSYCEVCDSHAPKDQPGNLIGPVTHKFGCPVGAALKVLDPRWQPWPHYDEAIMLPAKEMIDTLRRVSYQLATDDGHRLSLRHQIDRILAKVDGFVLCPRCLGSRIFQPTGQEEIYRCPTCLGNGYIKPTKSVAESAGAKAVTS